MNENDKADKIHQPENSDVGSKHTDQLWTRHSPREGLTEKGGAPGGEARGEVRCLDKPAGQFTTTHLADGGVRIEGYAAKGNGQPRDSQELALQKDVRKSAPAGLKSDASHGIPYDQGGRDRDNLSLKASVVNRSYDGSFERNLRSEIQDAHANGESVYMVFTGKRTEDGSHWSHGRTEVYRGHPDTGMNKVMDHQDKGDWYPSPERMQEHERMLKNREERGEVVTDKDRDLEMPSLNTVLGHDRSGKPHGATIDAETNRRMAGGQSATEWASPKPPPKGTPLH